MERSLDIETLMDASGGDHDTAVELIQLFCEMTGPEFSRLEGAAAVGDAATLSAAAHKCAGSCGACGMLALSQHLRNLEIASVAGMPDDLDARLETIRQEKTRVRKLLEEQFSESFEL